MNWVWDVLINSAQASPLCLLADQGALAKADWLSVEPAQRGDAGRHSGPTDKFSMLG
jgi:hypothetical protein